MKLSLTNVIGCVALAALTTFALPANADDAAKPAAKAEKKQAAKPAKQTEPAGLNITADLVGGKQLKGALLEMTTLELQTNFGVANIPLSEIAGVHLATADNAWTTVVLINGDSITGSTALAELAIQTEWGTAKIHGQNVESILFMPDLSWSSHSGLNGKRWILSKSDSSKPAAAASGTAVKGKSLSPAFPTQTNSVLYPAR